MKVLALLLFLFTLAVSSFAQTTEPSDISVVSYKWKRHQRAYINQEDPMRFYDEPFAANGQQKEWAQNQRQVTRGGATGERGINPVSTPSRSATPAGIDDASQALLGQAGSSQPNQPAFEYAYEVTLANRGVKKIRRLYWTYVLTDKGTNRDIGVHRFNSSVNLEAGKTKRIVGRSLAPPSRIVKASKPDAAEARHYSESVVIERIEFDDGSSWQRVEH